MDALTLTMLAVQEPDLVLVRPVVNGDSPKNRPNPPLWWAHVRCLAECVSPANRMPNVLEMYERPTPEQLLQRKHSDNECPTCRKKIWTD